MEIPRSSNRTDIGEVTLQGMQQSSYSVREEPQLSGSRRVARRYLPIQQTLGKREVGEKRATPGKSCEGDSVLRFLLEQEGEGNVRRRVPSGGIVGNCRRGEKELGPGHVGLVEGRHTEPCQRHKAG